MTTTAVYGHLKTGDNSLLLLPSIIIFDFFRRAVVCSKIVVVVYFHCWQWRITLSFIMEAGTVLWQVVASAYGAQAPTLFIQWDTDDETEGEVRGQWSREPRYKQQKHARPFHEVRQTSWWCSHVRGSPFYWSPILNTKLTVKTEQLVHHPLGKIPRNRPSPERNNRPTWSSLSFSTSALVFWSPNTLEAGHLHWLVCDEPKPMKLGTGRAITRAKRKQVYRKNKVWIGLVFGFCLFFRFYF